MNDYKRNMRRLDISIALARAGMVAGLIGVVIPYVSLTAGITADVLGVGLLITSVLIGRSVK